MTFTLVTSPKFPIAPFVRCHGVAFVYATWTSLVRYFYFFCLYSCLIPSALDCHGLTDLAVFELATLPKLHRIGLVRVNNITDEAIYALADRHATLERVHLSYCDQISVPAIHFLLQKLHKLTHLSLTGVSSFQQWDLQQFCREPPRVSPCTHSFGLSK